MHILDGNLGQRLIIPNIIYVKFDYTVDKPSSL